MVENSKFLLEVSNLKKYYNIKSGLFSSKNKIAKSVNDVSFNIQRGRIMGLVGESGCGKSTVGKTILRLSEATGGKVTFDDKIVFDVENKIKLSNREMCNLRKDMQIIFQDPYASLNPRKNIGSIIEEGMRKHKLGSMKEIHEQCEEILNLCGMDKNDFQRYPHEFSGGQRQRIGIARALAVKPKFLVCDEPTAALDVSIQSQILNLMLDFKEEFSLTYLFISHNLNVVRYFCDDICVMYLGKIVETGPAKELYENPLHPYTKALISSIPISNPMEKRERIILEGTIPGATDIPSGCAFRTRCKYASEICKKSVPILKNINEKCTVACHLYK